MRRATLLGVLVGLLLFAAVPDAKAANMRDFQRAQTIAASYFQPHCAPVRLQWTDDFPAPVHEAWSWVYRNGQTLLGGTECVVHLRTHAWRWDWPTICRVMVHEYGHLAGLEHTSSRRSIMYAEPVITPRRCRR